MIMLVRQGVGLDWIRDGKEMGRGDRGRTTKNSLAKTDPRAVPGATYRPRIPAGPEGVNWIASSLPKAVRASSTACHRRVPRKFAYASWRYEWKRVRQGNRGLD
jgi:hypothetical protein